VNSQAGRAIALVGIVLALIAIWIDFVSGTSYWDADGTIGAFLLVMSVICALLLAGNAVGTLPTGWLAIAGAILWGFYAFVPVALAFDQWDDTEAGTWLGFFGGALITLGAIIAMWRPGWAGRAIAMGPMTLIAALGIVLVFPGIWLDASSDGGSYWSTPGVGHSLGIVLLILAIAAALGLVAGVQRMATSRITTWICALTLGYVSFPIVSAAFNDFGTLGEGAWLAWVGGVLALGGMLAAARTEPATTAAPMPA
jgi:hypothetical protein